MRARLGCAALTPPPLRSLCGTWSDQIWADHLIKVVAYWNENGCPPSSVHPDPKMAILGRWCCEQRRAAVPQAPHRAHVLELIITTFGMDILSKKKRKKII